MSDIDYDEIYDETEEYKDEFAARERGGGDVLQGLLDSIEMIDGTDAENMKRKSPEDKFLIKLKKCFEDLEIPYGETRRFFEELNGKDRHNFKYRNPAAMTLGYVATGSSGKLSKKSFNRAVEKIELLVSDGSVQPPDVLRYARFLTKL